MRTPTRNEMEAKLLANRSFEDCGYKTRCWVWTGDCFSGTGYGRVWSPTHKARFLAHRIAAVIWLDFELTSRLCVLHHCDNPPCFNPTHLFAGTKKENTRDMMAKGRDRFGGPQPGERNGRSILTATAVREIRQQTDPYRRVPNGLYAELAESYGVSVILVRRVAKRKCWKHVE
jgi:hypothetical protein